MSPALIRINQSVWNDYPEAKDARLPALAPVEQLSARVIRILGGNAGLMRDISDPPSRLRACLKGSDMLRYSKFSALPVHQSLYQAPHLYSRQDVDQSSEVVNSLLPSETGKPLVAQQFIDLIAEVLEGALDSKDLCRQPRERYH
ncbi:hypothetical protein BBP40_008779 [Aspergillus hancockii]|nr:hypothetical protein BBP40_008779 [Aspergillus hancockii]